MAAFVKAERIECGRGLQQEYLLAIPPHIGIHCYAFCGKFEMSGDHKADSVKL